MKEAKRTFVCTLVLLIMFTGTVFAYTVNTEENVKNETYVKNYTGASSVCAIVGRTDLAYITVTNTSTATRYLTATVGENKRGYGWTARQSQSNDYAPGLQLMSSVVRDYTDADMFYQYIGKCHENRYNNHLYDDYQYIGTQRN